MRTKKGIVQLSVLIGVIALLAVGASVIVFGTRKEDTRNLDYICRSLPNSPNCKPPPSPWCISYYDETAQTSKTVCPSMPPRNTPKPTSTPPPAGNNRS